MKILACLYILAGISKLALVVRKIAHLALSIAFAASFEFTRPLRTKRAVHWSSVYILIDN
jgi:hypothetical protein